MRLVRGLVAAVTSIVPCPGFAHAALGRPRRGAVWLAVAGVGLVATSQSVWFLLLWFGAILGTAVDAFVLGYRTEREPAFRWVQAATIAMFFAAMTMVTAARRYIVESYKVPASSMIPTLEIGDRFVIDKLGSVERGDVIVFRYPCDPDRDYVKRLVARGGDTVEVRCNVVLVNGAALPSQRVAGDCSYRDFDDATGTWYTRPCSRFRETLAGHTYDVLHDAERPARDATPGQGDARDFPSRHEPVPPSCSGAIDPTQTLGTVVETTRSEGCAPQLHYVVPPGHVFVLGDNRFNSNDSRLWGGVPESAIKGRVVGIFASTGEDGLSLSRIGAVH